MANDGAMQSFNRLLYVMFSNSKPSLLVGGCVGGLVITLLGDGSPPNRFLIDYESIAARSPRSERNCDMQQRSVTSCFMMLIR